MERKRGREGRREGRREREGGRANGEGGREGGRVAEWVWTGRSVEQKASRLCVLRLCALKISKYAITTAACSLAVFNDKERKREATINTSSEGTTS